MQNKSLFPIILVLGAAIYYFTRLKVTGDNLKVNLAYIALKKGSGLSLPKIILTFNVQNVTNNTVFNAKSFTPNTPPKIKCTSPPSGGCGLGLPPKLITNTLQKIIAPSTNAIRHGQASFLDRKINITNDPTKKMLMS